MGQLEDDRAILDARARALARPIDPPAALTRLQLMTFSVGRERYGIEVRYLFQVFTLTTLAQLPGSKPPVAGLTRWRGDLLTVFDPRPILGVPDSRPNDLGRVLVVGDRRPTFGLLADQVLELVAVAVEGLTPPAPGADGKPRPIRGTTADAIMVLDAGSLLRMAATAPA